MSKPQSIPMQIKWDNIELILKTDSAKADFWQKALTIAMKRKDSNKILASLLVKLFNQVQYESKSKLDAIVSDVNQLLKGVI